MKINSDLFCIVLTYSYLCGMNYTLNCNGWLLSLAEPQVMGILNVTPDSFYGSSRQQTEAAIAQRVEEILSQGGCMVDVGACSTRPDSEPVSEAEEMERLHRALPIVRRVAPEAVVSVDTFRPSVARMVVEDYGVDIINDVGEGSATRPEREQAADMFRMVARLRVPYIYTSRKATMREVLLDCAEAVDRLRSLGQKDILLDPGFGFGKTLEQNYEVLNALERMQMIGLPVLVGVSRKSMIYRLLDTEPGQALNGSTVLHTIALQKGASILRVHDVREAVECCRLVRQTMNSK